MKTFEQFTESTGSVGVIGDLSGMLMDPSWMKYRSWDDFQGSFWFKRDRIVEIRDLLESMGYRMNVDEDVYTFEKRGHPTIWIRLDEAKTKASVEIDRRPS